MHGIQNKENEFGKIMSVILAIITFVTFAYFSFSLIRILESNPIYGCYGIDPKNNNVCSAHGICESPNRCRCGNGYIGEECQFAICPKITRRIDQFNATIGTCGIAKSRQTCFGISANDFFKICSGKGRCIGHDECQCQPGYTGTNCETPICFGKSTGDACSNNGKCVASNICLCNYGYYGLRCNDFKCQNIHFDKANVCDSHGKCIGHDTCRCTKNFAGLFCQQSLQAKIVTDYIKNLRW